MAQRKEYDQALEELMSMVAQMGELVAQANLNALKALEEGSEALAQQVIEEDAHINELERKVEHRCMELLLRQQPVASDLRRVSAALKLVTDLERGGDEAKNVAELVPWLARSGQPLPQGMCRMGQTAIAMTKDAVQAFTHGNAALAQAVVAQDDEVDQTFLRLRQELGKQLATEPAQIDAILDQLLIIRFWERLGDHAVNVAQWAGFSLTGMHNKSRLI